MAQQVRTWDGQSWLLDPGALFLDFVYTGEFGVGPWREGIITSGAELDAWLAEHVSPRLSPARPSEIEAALGLRESLSRIVKLAVTPDAELGGRDVSVIVRAASRPDLPPSLPGHEPRETYAAGMALAGIARDAILQLRDHRGRFRNCCGGDCPIVFLDLSRAGRRAWCSMTRCGNRAKVRAYRTRNPEKNTRRSEGT